MPSVYSAGSASVQIVPDFSNGQRAIQSWFASQPDAHIKVIPDLDNSRLAAMRALVGAQHADMKVGVDHRFFSSSMLKIIDSMTGLTEVGKVFSTLFGPRSILMTSGIGALTALAASAAQAGGAIGLLPAGLFALAAPIATIALATHGLADAFKIFSAQTPAQLKKAQEALAKLAPAARDFVMQVHQLAPAFTALRLDVQQQMFLGLGEQIRRVGTSVLPILRTNLAGVASSLNAMASQFLDVAGSASGLRSIAILMGNIRTAIANAGDAMGPLSRGMLDLTTVGSTFLPGIATGFTKAATAAGEWLTKARASGDLNKIFQTAVDTLKTLGGIVKNVASVLASVFSAAVGTGGTLLQIIRDLTGNLAAFLKLPVAQSALRSFFESIGAAVKVLAPALLTVVQALVTTVLPAIGGFVRALAPLVGSILVQFAKMLNEIAPLLYPALANAIVSILGALAPLIPIIGQIAVTLLPIFTRVLIQLAPIISQVSSLVGNALLSAVRLVAPVLPLLANAFIAILKAILPLLPPLLSLALALLPPILNLVRILVPVIVALVDAILPLIPIFIQLVRALLPVLVTLVNALAPVLPELARAFIQILQALIPILPPLINLLKLILPPLLVVLTALVRLAGTQLVMAFNLFAATLRLLVGVFTTVLNGVIGFVRNFHDYFFAFLHTVQALWNLTWTAISNFFTTIWRGIQRFFTVIWGAITGWWNAQASGYSRGWSNLWSSIGKFFSDIWKGIQHTAMTIWGQVAGFFAGAFRTFEGAFSTIWNRISSTFQAIWRGMATGVQRIWDGIRRIFAVPINFVINTILNNGLFAAWNWVNSHLKLGLPTLHLNPIPGFSEGGPTGRGIYGRGGRNDPAGVVHADEFVVKKGPAQKFAPLLYAINNEAPGYAVGGAVASLGSGGGGAATTWPALDSIRRRMFPGSVLTSAYRPGANDYHGLGEAIDIGWPGNTQAGLMPIAAALARAYPNSTELIHNPNGSIKNGRPVPPSFWGAATWAAHANHVHWAMTPSALSGAPGGGAGGDPGIYTGRLSGALSGALSGFFGHFGRGGIYDLIAAIPRALGSSLLGVIGSAVGKLLLGPSNDPTSINQTSSSMGLKNQAFSIAQLMYGWNSAADRAGLDYIATHESGWNPRAQNPVSSASGIWQMIDGTWRGYRGIGDQSYAHAKDAPTGDQDAAAFRYIHSRFGTPSAAQAYWAAHHSYDSGGWLPPGISTVYNGTGHPEPVLTHEEHQGLKKWQRSNRENGGLVRDVHIHAERERASEIMEELWHKLKVAQRGGVYSTASVYF